MLTLLKTNRLYLCWLIAVVGTLGSLSFQLFNFIPCNLCWYQRICMYPLVVILTVAVIKKDRLAPLYALPLTILGMVLGLYQNLLIYKLLPETSSVCQNGVPCNVDYLNLFGFITIPLLSTIAFGLLTILLWWQWRAHDQGA